MGQLSLSETEEILKLCKILVKMRHSSPICEFLDDIPDSARLKLRLGSLATQLLRETTEF